MTPTRRQLLAGTGAVVGTVGISGAAAARVTVEEIETDEPSPGTWPTHRYDAANTATNPHASPPSDPEIDWRVPVDADNAWEDGFVVGPERVYYAGTQLTALDRANGWRRWSRNEPSGALAVRDGTLYHCHGGDDSSLPRLSAFDARTGDPRWRTAVPEDSRGPTVTADRVFVSGRAFDAEDGRLEWTLDGNVNPGWTDSVAQDGVLYAEHSARRVSKYSARSVLDETLNRGSQPVWQRRHDRPYADTVVQDDRLVRTRGVNVGGAAIAGFDTETGRRTWAALTSEEFKSTTDTGPGDPDHFGVTTSGQAVTSEQCIVIARTISYGRSEEIDKQTSALVAVSLSDGTVRWTRSFLRPDHPADTGVFSVLVADGTVLVRVREGMPEYEQREGPPYPGRILALDADTGETLWGIKIDHEPAQLAVADDTIFAITDGRSDSEESTAVLALR
jgi:outer membrane protein assembly factor BamB